MSPYYAVKDGQVVRWVRTLTQPIEINTADYDQYIDAKNYTVSMHKENDDHPRRSPLYIVDVTFGGDYTIFCEHFGELLTVVALLSNLFPRQGPHRK